MTSSSYRSINSFFIESLGCAKNQVDSEYIIGALKSEGLEYKKEDSSTADVIIINTCAFINDAKEEAIQVILDYRKAYPGKKIIVAGCLSQRYGSDLEKNLPEADGLLGNRAPEEIVRVVRDLRENERAVHFPENPGKAVLRSDFLSYSGSSYVKIGEGCRNNCRYCAIPLIRGDLVSRKEPEIINEIRFLLNQGITELNLVSQDLANYGLDNGEKGLVSLVEKISQLSGSFWVRLLYIHPAHFPRPLLTILKEDKRILPYFDLPFQHASSEVLKKMGRPVLTPEESFSLIQEIRNTVPDAVIRSTFLVGFPGESDKDFQTLLDFQEKAQLDWLGVFVYSREEGTPAASDPDRLNRKKKIKRKEELELRQIPITEKRLQRYLNRELDILVEEPIKGESLYFGRAYLQAPEVDGLTVLHGENLKPGQLKRARIIKINGFDLEAAPL